MRRGALLTAVLVVVASLLAAGCGSEDDPVEGARDTTPAPTTGPGVEGTSGEDGSDGEPGAPGAAIEGTTWELDAASSEHPDGPLPEVNVQLRLEDGSVSGSDGCNRITGSYTLEGDAIELGELAGTMMACPEPPDAMERAARYVASLESGGTLELVEADGGAEGPTLVLSTADGATLRYRPEPPQAPLEPTALVGTWNMTLEEQSGEGETASTSASPVGTITFGDDGSVSGQGPCNTFGGTYTATGMAAFDIAPLTQTYASCDAVVDHLEATTFSHLQEATNWGTLPGDRIELMAGEPTFRILLDRAS